MRRVSREVARFLDAGSWCSALAQLSD